MTPSRANIEPIERSMPPVMMTMPSPIENRPNRPMRFAVLPRLIGDRKRGFRMETTSADHDDQQEQTEILLQHRHGLRFLQVAPADGQPHHVLLAELGRARGSRAIRPSRMTTMRSLTPITSSMSLEIMRTATPASASPRISL